MSQAIDLKINTDGRLKITKKHKHRKQSKNFTDWVDRFLTGVDYTKYKT